MLSFAVVPVPPYGEPRLRFSPPVAREVPECKKERRRFGDIPDDLVPGFGEVRRGRRDVAIDDRRAGQHRNLRGENIYLTRPRGQLTERPRDAGLRPARVRCGGEGPVGPGQLRVPLPAEAVKESLPCERALCVAVREHIADFFADGWNLLPESASAEWQPAKN